MNICMVAYSFYETDNRVRRYAETLSKMDYQVDALALRKPGQLKFENINGVSVHRIQVRSINEKGKLSYLYRLFKFFVVTSFWLARKQFNKQYEVIHVHSVPDFEVFAAFIPKIQGAKIFLDIHDIVPELFSEKFGVSRNNIVVKALKVVEKLSCSFSDHVIIANDLWREKLIKRSVPSEKCTTILNYPCMDIFKRNTANKKKTGKSIMIYPGTLAFHQGVDIAIRASRIIRTIISDFEFHIYGRGSQRDNLCSLIENLGLSKIVHINNPVPIEEIAQRMSEADIGVVPKRAEGFGDEALSTKIFEFMAVGLPVITSKTTIDSFFPEESVLFFQSGNPEDLAEKVVFLLQNSGARRKQVLFADSFINENLWENKKHIYLGVLDKI